MKSYDLLNTVNTRGTFMCSKLCLSSLKKAVNPHILTLSPPLNLNPMWFGNHVAYTISKYGMSMCVLGMAREFRGFGIAVNALWPRTAIYTAATKMLAGGEDFSSQCRVPEIVSDAAYAILTRPAKDPKNTGNFFIDEEVLREEGVTDFDMYAIKPGASLAPDFFLDSPKTHFDDASTGTVPKGSVEAIFDKLQSLLSEEHVKNVGASFYFVLTDPEPGHWFIDLRAGSGCAGRAETDASEFDCRFELGSDQFVKMFEGKVIPSKAFIAGDLHIDGDVFAAIKLEKLLKNMNK
ncbi:hypothetical protein T265_07547 [Opisthorchis viverrini]|uniref:Hydroxysteroid dehydrogenase-like protein 2 n=1 Tax=Opisthorchis viverrini TaxID=6198 RepID=A0A074ZC33_OPIVI|nr:hypothetical protein T265_07547 [Opisthorchis viverrini]KER24871.1 hypothetical protein T265_07547 [Opisthorchis viverrini]